MPSVVPNPPIGSIVGFDDAALDNRLTPGHERPLPVPEPGTNAAAADLDLFDGLVLQRRAAAMAEHGLCADFIQPSPRP